MKAIVDSQVLLKGLSDMTPALSKNSIMPVLEMVKLSFSKDLLVATVTNLDSTVVVKMKATSKEEFVILVPFLELANICKVSAGPLTIQQKDKNFLLDSDKAKFKIQKTAEPKDFPSTEDVEYFNEIEVDGDFFFAMAGAYSERSVDNSRPQMTGVGLDFSKGIISVVGTNAMSLYKRDFEKKFSKNIVVNVDGEFIPLTKKLQEAKIAISSKFIKAETENFTVISRLQETPFITYKPVLKSEFNWVASIDRKEFLSAISTVSIAADTKTSAVILQFSGNKMSIESSDKNFGKEAKTEMEINTSGEEIASVCLNGKALTALLNSLYSEEIAIDINASTSAVYIKPTDSDDTLLLIMPLMLPDYENQ